LSAAGYQADVVGHVVLDAGGERIGQVSTLYVDTDTNLVSFAGVAMLRRGRRRVVFVPLADATVSKASITVRCGKELARRAPSVRPGEVLPADAEAELFAHYEIPYAPVESRHGHRLTPYI
jgi:hypothetical protein